MKNTRLVVIRPIDKDSMMLSLYYGNRKADQAVMSGLKEASHEDLLATIEQFRLYGAGDDK